MAITRSVLPVPFALAVAAAIVLAQYLCGLATLTSASRVAFAFARDGGLMAYGPDTTDIYRPAARLVAKILHGATPADLPIERPMQFELVINLKTAQELGLTIPPTLLFQADEIIR